MSFLTAKSYSLFARQCLINSNNSSSKNTITRNFFQGLDLGNRNREALDKVCQQLLRARADPFHGHRKERLPDSEQKKINAR